MVSDRSVILVTRSKNEKVGVASATYASIEGSCPKDCAQKNAGCYAQLGNVGIHVSRLDKSLTSNDARNVARLEAKLINDAVNRGEATLPLRLHVSGDCRTESAARIVSEAASKWSNKVWTYTHAWKKVPRSAWGTVSVLASVDRPEDIALARERGYAPAIVVESHASPKAKLMHGTKFIPCPAQTKSVTCTSCQLCFDANRLHKDGFGISFAAHGPAKKRLSVVK